MFCEIPEFGRCCFCMPLRRGILVFGYLNILFSMFMIGVYSLSVNEGYGMLMLFHGVATRMEEELCITIYVVDIIFNIVLLYGAHRKMMIYLKIFYYYTLATVVAVVILEIVSIVGSQFFEAFELLALFCLGLCIHLYLLFLVRTLLKNMDIQGSAYENQLQQFINGEIRVEGNGVYPNIVVPNETV
ncbi:uncharacterized protein LOC133318772 [Danaus plexippus]|uniref:Uncharacterized protein n=1 Tax=Danaus plexippus plexippus TaxID=278856 RepID=A0A212EVT5_DANPL|nr:uncharacterized protein LOC133318772 [Danaus plexippus]OWR45602.1 hypothetical protein KGM_205483 [Danaus plexippus plexippus]